MGRSITHHHSSLDTQPSQDHTLGLFPHQGAHSLPFKCLLRASCGPQPPPTMHPPPQWGTRPEWEGGVGHPHTSLPVGPRAVLPSHFSSNSSICAGGRCQEPCFMEVRNLTTLKQQL